MKPYNITLHFKVWQESGPAAFARISEPELMAEINAKVQKLARRMIGALGDDVPSTFVLGSEDRVDWRCLVTIHEAD